MYFWNHRKIPISMNSTFFSLYSKSIVFKVEIRVQKRFCITFFVFTKIIITINTLLNGCMYSIPYHK